VSALREEQRVRIFENRVLKKVCACKRGEETKYRRRLRDEAPQSLLSTNVINKLL
jgi:hypothetical protein